MNTTLTEIKNQYAQEQGYEDWDTLQESKYLADVIESYWTEVCIRAQKAYGEKAAENSRINGGEFSRCGCEIDTSSITNPENLIQ